ncbi:hypothetical protein F4813DRAFT_396061 [Daldinia decipiens]|uniref:uncharacterized protein n=1 Tax=Daldinia decipiens TaxID=326647 RepID=UPI0020C3C71B|nr:uncharacterized protein F4813DRAFT_396061 [Daldinia decipiens]KAI1657891.1 hypothetical protein F4813DRAFT_396061 [Daldinia decipiens]
MARQNPSVSLPYAGIIKVYSSEDDSLVVWTNPRHIHLHKKTSSGRTACCDSFTAGGIVENHVGTLHFLTSDRFVPADAEPYMDTRDKTCACVGYVQHTSRRLHYTLVAISDAVADREAIRQAKILGCIPASTQQIHEFTMRPIMLRDLHRQYGLTLLARTRHNQVIKGRLTVLPRKAIDPSYRGSRLVFAQFDPALVYLDEGMWVYARQPSAEMLDNMTNEMLARLDSGPYHCETFRYRYNFSHSNQPYYTLRIVGHIVEIRGRDSDGCVEVAIQCSHEVLSEISLLRDWLDNPDGSNPPPTYFR